MNVENVKRHAYSLHTTAKSTCDLHRPAFLRKTMLVVLDLGRQLSPQQLQLRLHRVLLVQEVLDTKQADMSTCYCDEVTAQNMIKLGSYSRAE
jgi:hypothetical protein